MLADIGALAFVQKLQGSLKALFSVDITRGRMDSMGV